MSKKLGVFIVAAASVTSGCMSTPPLSEATGTEHSEILIKDVVQRVKCELSDAFDKKTEQPDYLWLASWTAHIDLTLTINDDAGISPNGSFTKFRNSTINTDAGPLAAKTAVSQFFSVTAGANLSGQAVRTETVSFTVALDELKRWRESIDKAEADPHFRPERKVCNFDAGTGITGNLGLKEWVDSAFYPAEIGQLQAGIHPAPGGMRPSLMQGPQQQTGGQFKALIELSDADKIRKVKDWLSKLKTLQAATKESAATIATASQKITQAKTAIKNKIDEAKQYKYVMVPYLQARYAKVSRQMSAYVKNAENCSAYKADIDHAFVLAYDVLPSPNGPDPQTLSGAASAAYDKLQALMTSKIESGNYEKGSFECSINLQGQADEAALLPNSLPAQADPPIDSVLHSVQFVVSVGANITPSWTLVQWKGPGQSQNGNLLSASGVRTHNLVIALGPRTGAAAISSDATRLIQNQAVRSLAN